MLETRTSNLMITTTSTQVMAAFRAYARVAYECGDQRIGDLLTAHAVAWEVAGAEGRLPAVPR